MMIMMMMMVMMMMRMMMMIMIMMWQLVVAGLQCRSHPDSPTVPEIEVTGGGRGAGDMVYHIHISDKINLK